VHWVASGSDAVRRIHQQRFAAVLTDLRLPGKDGIDVLREVKSVDPECPVIVMTGYGTIETAVEAMRQGAFDFIQKPVDVDYLGMLLRRSLEHRELRSENLLLREEFRNRLGLPAIIGDSAPIREVAQQIQRVAATDAAVLLLGESGTGKELFARAIHQLSTRRDRPFVAVNCAAIPDTLLENELFGHEKGAYTGASGRQLGKVELADGGTLFLDEIGELGIGVQAKVLRFLQEHTFERIGGGQKITVDVRVICATNRDLQQGVREGTFREDLFYRINVFPVTVPPLRARREDIPALCDFFLDRFRRELGRPHLQISADAMQLLVAAHWPGNIRELENCLERAAILCDGAVIQSRDLVVLSDSDPARLRELIDFSGPLTTVVDRAVQKVEKVKIEEVLARSASKQEAADALGISYRTLLAKIRQHGLGGSEET
jgi:DNA-binding NtrC family response regulator